MKLFPAVIQLLQVTADQVEEYKEYPDHVAVILTSGHAYNLPLTDGHLQPPTKLYHPVKATCAPSVTQPSPPVTTDSDKVGQIELHQRQIPSKPVTRRVRLPKKQRGKT